MKCHVYVWEHVRIELPTIRLETWEPSLIRDEVWNRVKDQVTHPVDFQMWEMNNPVDFRMWEMNKDA